MTICSTWYASLLHIKLPPKSKQSNKENKSNTRTIYLDLLQLSIDWLGLLTPTGGICLQQHSISYHRILSLLRKQGLSPETPSMSQDSAHFGKSKTIGNLTGGATWGIKKEHLGYLGILPDSSKHSTIPHPRYPNWELSFCISKVYLDNMTLKEVSREVLRIFRSNRKTRITFLSDQATSPP